VKIGPRPNIRCCPGASSPERTGNVGARETLTPDHCRAHQQLQLRLQPNYPPGQILNFLLLLFHGLGLAADCLYVTLGRQLKALAPGLTARSALEKFAAVQMVDVHIPTTDGRELMLTRYTQPERELQLLLEQLRLQLPDQPPPKISAAQAASAHTL